MLLLAGTLLATGAAHAGEAATARKASAVKSEPYRDAKAVGALAQGDKVEILATRGGWFRVKSANGNGWVRMLDIRRGQPRAGSVDSDGLLALASGRAGTGRVVASTGIRGLNEEELKAAHYDAAELARLDAYGVTQAEAVKQAVRSGLARREVE